MKWLEIPPPKQALLGMFVPSQSHCSVLLLSEVMVSILQPTAKWFLAFKLSKELLSILFLKPVNTAVHTIASNTTSWRACVGTGWGLPENNPFAAGMLHFFCPENSLVLCWGHCWDYISASRRILSEERSHEMKQWMLESHSELMCVLCRGFCIQRFP